MLIERREGETEGIKKESVWVGEIYPAWMTGQR